MSSSNDNNASSSSNNNASSSSNNNAGSSDDNSTSNSTSNRNAGDYPAAPLLAPLSATGMSKEVYLQTMAALSAEPSEWVGEAELELVR
jgi:hypothetical protein